MDINSSEQPVPILELDAPLASAVATMLRRQGCPASTVAGETGQVVIVPRSRRSEALALVADAMDELVATAEPSERAAPVAADDDEPRRTMVLPRLRGAGIAILLVPVLVVTLSSVNIPVQVAAFLVVAGIVALIALRTRADRDDG